MQANQLLTADMLDILFDGKNKAYGAYNLRKTYNNRLLKSMLILLSLLTLLVTSFFVHAAKEVKSNDPVIVTSVIDLEPPTKDPEPPAPTPPPAPAPPEHIRTVASINNIVIVPEDVRDADKPPTVAEQENARISNITTDGIDDTNLTGPNSNVIGTGTGVVSKPQGTGNGTEENVNSFIPIEIESEYPGGVKAWRRFLDRNLGNNYPEDAYEKRIQGTVVIQFIVDRDGTVSNVEAVSGPEELRDAAITVIKRSGKWDPAIQNGNKVKSYKKQPISFRLME